MATGYLVTLGNNALNAGDFIAASQSTFTSATTLGTGSWTWSGRIGTTNYSNQTGTGTYYQATDGNVYFVPSGAMPIGGTGTATTAPSFTDDATIDGTTGNDSINKSYTDAQGDHVTSGSNTIVAGTGNDTVYAEGGDDSISGGSGNDVLYGDSASTATASTTTMSWANQGITDETSVTSGINALSADGNIRVNFTVAQEQNFASTSMETTDVLYNYNALSDTSSIEVFGGNSSSGGTIGNNQNAATITLDFSAATSGYSDEVSNVTFGIHDLDELSGQFRDQVIIRAYDADGNQIAVTLTPGSTTTITTSTAANGTATATAITGSGGSGSINAVTGFVQVSVAGPVSYITIDYNNTDTAYGAHAIRIGDLQMTTIPSTDGNDNISGDDGDDILYGQGGNDTLDGGTGNDFLYGGTGNDVMQGGTGNDSLYGGDGNDIINDSGTTADYIEGGNGNDSINAGAGDDIVYGGAGNDTLNGGTGNDILNGDAGNDILNGDAGNDTLNGGDGNDTLNGGDGNDTLTGGAGNDSITGGNGSDRIILGNSFGTDTINGSEDTGNTDVDILDASTMTTATTVNMSGPEAGTLTSGTNTATFSNIEQIVTGSGADSITGSTGNDTITAGAGADRVNAGAGNDQINLGAGTATDGAADVVVLQDGSGNDIIRGFDAPTGSGNTWTGVDKLDVSNLYDLPAGNAARTPVRTNDVVVTNDGSGNAVLTFPNGESVTLMGVSSTTAANPFYLNAIGIPMPDGTVSGTAGDDTINSSYTGDPDGDRVDGGDAILSGHNGNDDLIEAGAGNDTVLANLGNDTIYAGTGDDLVYGGDGNDTIYGEAGNDHLVGEAGNDVIYGGDGNDLLFGFEDNDALYGGSGNDIINGGSGNDILQGGEGADRFVLEANFGNDTITGGETGLDNDTIWSTQGVDTVTVLTGNEAGTITDGTSTATFSEIEVVNVGAGNDTVNASASNAAITVYANAGNDTVTGSSANDSLYGGAGNDTIDGGAGNDILQGGDGDDTFVVKNGFGNDVITGGEGAETDGDTVDLSQTTTNLTLNLTAADGESGSFTDGLGNGTSFSQIENIVLGGGNDTIVLNNTSGDYTVQGFTSPTSNNGVLTGVDKLNVTGLLDLGGDPVNVNDVTVTDDGNGNAVLTFPGGQSITLDGVSPATADNTQYLNAIGIPLSDGTVSGTAGDDTINSAYTGDPDGDRVDSGDAILSGHAPNDDLIEAGAGNDTIYTGAGNNTVYAGTGNDQIYAGVGSNNTIYGEDGDDNIIGNSGSDTEFGGTGNDQLFGFDGNDSLDGGAGNDVMYGGVGDDTMAGGDGADRFNLEAGFGSDSITGGEGGLDNDTILSTQGVDTVTILTGDEAGTFSDGTSTATFSEIEVIDLGSGDDTVDASASDAAITIYGGSGDDDLTGSSANDVIFGGFGEDIITGGAGDDSLYGGEDDDTFIIVDGFGNDTIVGGEGGEFWGDWINGENLTQDTTVIFSGPEAGTLSSGGSTLSFSEVEEIVLGSGNDSVLGSSGDDIISTEGGSDTVDAGAGNDIISLGAGDLDADLVILQNGSGDDEIFSFDAPIDNLDGTFTGVDKLDVTNMLDLGGDPVNTNDVVVTDDGSGNALLTFPSGDSVILHGISPTAASDPFYLNAIGIPMPDGTVSGTAGDDIIDGSYTGDPDGDRVDNDDAILAGDTGNDDLIYAYGGNDVINSGDGNDLIFAGTGNDIVAAGDGNDELHGDDGDDQLYGNAGNDVIYGGTGNDAIYGGEGADTQYGLTGNDSFVLNANYGSDVIYGGEDADGNDNDTLYNAQDLNTTVTATGDEAGSITSGGSTATFSQIETIITAGGDDNINLGADSAGMTVDSGAGIDSITGGSGNDVISAGLGNDHVNSGAGNDLVFGGDGNDTLTGGAGDDTIYGDGGIDTLYGGTGNDILDGGTGIDTLYGGDGTDTLIGGTGNDILSGGTGADTIYGGDDADRIYLEANFGNDTIAGGEGGTDSDAIYSTHGANTTAILTGDEAGTITDGTSTATFSEIEILSMGSGNDLVDASASNASISVYGNLGNDTITGSSANDSLYGGVGNDTISGGAGSDIISGGDGSDTITFSDGDTADGGTGDDTFVAADYSETSNGTITVTGGQGGESTTGDTLQLGKLADMSTLNITSTTVNTDGNTSYTGSVTMDDGTILNFSEIENIICFTPGTRIATPKGARDIATLRVGDLVVTRDHGLQPIRWIQSRTVPAMENFAPIRIRPGVITGQDRDLLVSPQHRMLFQGYRAELLFGESEVLVSAKHMLDGKYVTQETGGNVTYIHMMFDEHEVVYAEGAATESFHPGDVGLTAVSDPAREELFALFPELRTNVNGYGQTARRCLKSHESKLLIV